MTDPAVAVILFLIHGINFQWAFRCQRVGRGILLLALDGVATHRELFASIMPSGYSSSIWLGRLIWVGAAVFAWRAWAWFGVFLVIIYPFALAALVDNISPWPSYSKLLGLIRDRILTGAAGTEGMVLLPTIQLFIPRHSQARSDPHRTEA
jgi:hypothetical protein